jgi:hypothetical protein
MKNNNIKINWKTNILCLGLIALLCSACKKEAPLHIVSGRIFDAVTHLPVPNAEIREGGTNGQSVNGIMLAQCDSDGYYYFEYRYELPNNEIYVQHLGYGGYLSTQKFAIPLQLETRDFDLQINPTTHINLIVSKTIDLADTVLEIVYTSPTKYASHHAIYVSNTTSPDTLQILALAGMNNKINLFVSRYNSWPPLTPYINDNYSYNIFCNSTATTQFLINY